VKNDKEVAIAKLLAMLSLKSAPVDPQSVNVRLRVCLSLWRVIKVDLGVPLATAETSQPQKSMRKILVIIHAYILDVLDKHTNEVNRVTAAEFLLDPQWLRMTQEISS
jgi:hypothetical protein